MAGRMKEILAYSGVVFVFLYAWYSLDISDLMGNGTNWIPGPILSLAAIAVVTGFFFDWLLGYTGLDVVRAAMTIGAVRILFYDIIGIMIGNQNSLGAIIDIFFTLTLSYVAGKTYEKVARQS